MERIDLASDRWRAIRSLWEGGVAAETIAAAAGMTTGYVERIARREGWTRERASAPPDTTGLHGRLMAALSRRVLDLSAHELDDPETLARTLTALARGTDAAGRLAEAFGGAHGVTRDEDAVRASLRRKLQVFARRARAGA